MTPEPQFDPERSEAIRALLVETVAASFDRPARKRRRWLIIGSIAVGSLTLAGSAGAWGVSHGATWIALPSSTPGGAPSYAPIGRWPVNAAGQTYGAQGDSPVAPDLIAVSATNNKDGYVYSKDLEDADGTTAMRSFTSPQQALDWQKKHGGKVTYIPVYKSDGKTKIGVFQVGP